jgi:hypothetical protein
MLQLGSIYFKFKQQIAYRPKRLYIHIQRLDQPEHELKIEILGTDEKRSPKELEFYLVWAAKHAWGREVADSWKIQQRKHEIKQVDWLIQDEYNLAMQISTLGGGKPQAAFQQQMNWQDLQALGEELELNWPSAWQQLYTYNSIEGGWGPDSGFFPLFPTSVHQHNIKTTYRHFHKDHPARQLWRQQLNLLPFLHWGTDVYSILDCGSKEGRVYSFDPNLKNENNRWEDCLWLHQESLYAWLKFWLDSEDYGLALWRNMYEQKGIL